MGRYANSTRHHNAMRIYISDIRLWDRYYGIEYLCPQRRQKMERYRQPLDKMRCLVAGLLVDYALGYGSSQHIMLGPYGKPFIPKGQFFSISHSHHYVALVCAPYAVGIDVEHIAPYDVSILKKCCTQEEAHYLTLHGNDAFYKLWTAKESVMKATGLGFTLKPTGFSVLPLVDGRHDTGSGGTWYLYWHSLDEHEMCIASERTQHEEHTGATESSLLMTTLTPESICKELSSPLKKCTLRRPLRSGDKKSNRLCISHTRCSR